MLLLSAPCVVRDKGFRGMARPYGCGYAGQMGIRESGYQVDKTLDKLDQLSETCSVGRGCSWSRII